MLANGRSRSPCPGVYRQGTAAWISRWSCPTPFYGHTLFSARYADDDRRFYAERFRQPVPAGPTDLQLASPSFWRRMGMLVAGDDGGDDAEATRSARVERASTRSSRIPSARGSPAGRPDAPQTVRGVLRQKEQRGELRSFVSHVNEVWFFVIYAVVAARTR